MSVIPKPVTQLRIIAALPQMMEIVFVAVPDIVESIRFAGFGSLEDADYTYHALRLKINPLYDFNEVLKYIEALR